MRAGFRPGKLLSQSPGMALTSLHLNFDVPENCGAAGIVVSVHQVYGHVLGQKETKAPFVEVAQSCVRMTKK